MRLCLFETRGTRNLPRRGAVNGIHSGGAFCFTYPVLLAYLEIMPLISFSVPEEALLALKTGPDRLADELRLAAAIKLYELGRISSGVAAKLAGIPRVLLLTKLSEYGVTTFELGEDELKRELELG